MVELSLAASAILVLLNGIFVGYEFAILKASPYSLETMAAEGNRGAALGIPFRTAAFNLSSGTPSRGATIATDAFDAVLYGTPGRGALPRAVADVSRETMAGAALPP